MFHFKKFSLSDDKSSMKVGTDGVLLGIAVKANNAMRILDVGTGCGLIALMLAQKSKAAIDALDIDRQSCQQAYDNFQLSPWENQLNVIEADFSAFANQTIARYDLIVSNPPFFEYGDRKPNLRQSRARHNDSLSFEDLCQSTVALLKEGGRLCVIIPDNRLTDLIRAAIDVGLFLSDVLLVHPVTGRRPNRYIAEFSKEQQGFVKFNRLFIREENGLYTVCFKEYVKDYYLDFPY
jgi:tRNA1Val (adenine37-N6)-methyltransferase